MAELNKKEPATMEELLVGSFAAADALAKLLIQKGLITEKAYYDRVSKERGLYQRILKRINAGAVGNA
jgi:flagellar biosynthesis regulator FlbT